MRKIKTYSEKIEMIDPVTNLKVVGWEKKCPICGKTYQTTSRSQKFCSSECCKKAQAKKYRQQKEYDKTKEVVRLSSRSHSIAVEVINQLVALGIREYKCEICGETHELQVHHKNLRYLDNSPENLQLLCTKCHAEEHSRIEREIKPNQNLEDVYGEGYELYKVLLK